MVKKEEYHHYIRYLASRCELVLGTDSPTRRRKRSLLDTERAALQCSGPVEGGVRRGRPRGCLHQGRSGGLGILLQLPYGRFEGKALLRGGVAHVLQLRIVLFDEVVGLEDV